MFYKENKQGLKEYWAFLESQLLEFLGHVDTKRLTYLPDDSE